MPVFLADAFTIPPKASETHLGADYVELLCLHDVDGMVSKSDVLVSIHKGDDLVESEEEAGHGGGDFTYPDRLVGRVDDWFRHVQYRAAAFGEVYPFHLTEDCGTLCRTRRVTLNHKMYLFLLLSANLRCFDKQRQGHLAAAFEVASLEALRQYLPRESTVRQFGKNALRQPRHYTGSIWRKVERLASDIRERLACEEADFKPQSTGDEGLDLVAWLPIGKSDVAPGVLTVFAQCACTAKWVTKQHSSSATSWQPYISFTVKPANIVFIPFCFRDPTGEWFNRTDIKDSILVDRVRLVQLLRGKSRSLSSFAYRVVDEVLAT
jgi:hypothetical protein